MRPVLQMNPQLAPTAVAQAYPRRARTEGVNLPCLSDEGPRRLCRGVLSSEFAVPRGWALVVLGGEFGAAGQCPGADGFRAARFEGGEPGVNLGELAQVIEFIELGVEAGCCKLRCSARAGFLQPNL